MKKAKITRQAEDAQRKAMTKKALKEVHKAQRVHDTMNTGTRTHKTSKQYDRQRDKRQAEREAQ